MALLTFKKIKKMIKLGKEVMRLDKYISKSLSKSRTDVKKILSKKLVKVNGITVTKASFDVSVNDNITYMNDKLEYNEFIYLMMNKPSGYICSTEDAKDKIILELLNEKDLYFKPFPMGRLDKDTEGLVILTNDGKLSHNLLSPKKHIPKTYYVETKEILNDEMIYLLEKEIDLKDFVTKPSIVDKIDDKSMYLTIFEGKFHQIKRMLEYVNNEVTYLKRIKMNNLELDNKLNLGEYRHLTLDELKLLKGEK